jgi:hypothetical protein
MEKNAYRLSQQNPATTVEANDLFSLTRLSNPKGQQDMMINGVNLINAMGGGSGGNMPVVTVTGASQQLSSNYRYYINRPSLVMLTLPLISNVGDVIEIVNMSNSWQLAQNSGQNMTLANKTTTTGTAGYFASANNGDVIRLECVVANDFWIASTVIGNITVN